MSVALQSIENVRRFFIKYLTTSRIPVPFFIIGCVNHNQNYECANASVGIHQPILDKINIQVHPHSKLRPRRTLCWYTVEIMTAIKTLIWLLN